MSGGNPSTRQITLQELATHNTRGNAWIALRGKVFDISSYIDKHPGGYSTIQKGFGIDATRLFNQAHSYVNFENVLKGKQVGVLAPTESVHGGSSNLAPTDPSISSQMANSNEVPPNTPTS